MNSTLYNSNFHRGIHHYGCYSNSNDRKSNYNIIKGFYSCHLHSSSSFFNLCSSWNINSWNSEKRDVVMYLNSVFKPETGNSKFLSKGNSPSIFGLYIDVHNSCSYTAENANYNYIISSYNPLISNYNIEYRISL
ncbi:hypothetical protein U3516DRAFT_763866 [Neocallimastix sp. 'constans']